MPILSRQRVVPCMVHYASQAYTSQRQDSRPRKPAERGIPRDPAMATGREKFSGPSWHTHVLYST